MESKTMRDILMAAVDADKVEFRKFAGDCPAHFGRMCVNEGNPGLLCKYEGCPHKVMGVKRGAHGSRS